MPEEIAYYTLYRNEEQLVISTGTHIEIQHKGKCKRYNVTVTDTDNQESQLSNTLTLCNSKGKK